MLQAKRLVVEGTAMIDVGGQSTRPGHEEVSVAEEIGRVVPVIAAVARNLLNDGCSARRSWRASRPSSVAPSS